MIFINENACWQADESAFTSTKRSFNHANVDIEPQFRQAMQAAGIHYSGELIADGKLHRFHIEGHKRGSKNGAYILHVDECPAGWFLNYKTGVSQKWRKSGSMGHIPRQMTAEIEKAKCEREAEQRQRYEAAAVKARSIWNRSKPILEKLDHAYLVNKGIQSNGARLYRESLVIQLLDARKQIVNLQFIHPDGTKIFLSGGRKYGCFHPIGEPTQKILIAEGFATAATLHEETGLCTIAAMDAGNMLPVAQVIRKMFPTHEIIICGDNDVSGVGQSKAKEAALAIGSKVSIPPVVGMDWNDYLMRGNHNG